jgi:hypothetical protein
MRTTLSPAAAASRFETPPFIAKNLISRLKQYAETLKTPFFGALVDYAEQGNQLWTCPGHNGGVFYGRSPIGRVFMEHLGEAVFRDDLDNSVLELGDLLTHEGPALLAQKEAARAAAPIAPVPTSLLPCWVQTPSLRVKTHAAPVSELSPRPPTMAVLPLRDTATDPP